LSNYNTPQFIWPFQGLGKKEGAHSGSQWSMAIPRMNNMTLFVEEQTGDPPLVLDSDPHEIPCPSFVNLGLVEIADAIQSLRSDAMSLLDNAGEQEYVNAVFAMRTHCWCGGLRFGHEERCPPNFQHFPTGLSLTWYKHAGRSSALNKGIDKKEWRRIAEECVLSVAPWPPATPCS